MSVSVICIKNLCDGIFLDTNRSFLTQIRRMYDLRWLRHLLLSFSSPFGRAKTKPKMPHLFLPKPPVSRELLQELNFRRRQFVSKKTKFVSKKPFSQKCIQNERDFYNSPINFAVRTPRLINYMASLYYWHIMRLYNVIKG